MLTIRREDYQEQLLETKEMILREARESGLVERAEENARRIAGDILLSSGMGEAEIRFSEALMWESRLDSPGYSYGE